MEEIVRYRRLEDGDGLSLEDGMLSAFHQGRLLGEAQVPAEADLDELLGGYFVPELLPDLSFSHSAPRNFSLTISIVSSLPGLVFGELFADGERGLWQAHRTRSSLFLVSDRRAGARRTYAREEKRGSGWEITLPSFLMPHDDPIVRQRAALALEAFLYALEAGRDIDLPHRRGFSNVFSVTEPSWPANLPLVFGVPNPNSVVLPAVEA